MKILHILNGDATAHVFNQTEFEGDVLIWPEILSEGPVSATDLWNLRSAWLSKNFGGPQDDYATRMSIIIERLMHVENYDEITLWFEFDLTCQINLIYILSLIRKVNVQNLNVFLICPAKISGTPNFRGLGELDPQQLISLLPTKVQLNEADLDLAAKAWDLYITNHPYEISEFLNKDFGNLTLLKKALRAHLSRFPSPATQLNHIEEVLLQIINSGIRTLPDIYEAFWFREPIFGMGDLQLNLVLEQLRKKKLISI